MPTPVDVIDAPFDSVHEASLRPSASRAVQALTARPGVDDDEVTKAADRMGGQWGAAIASGVSRQSAPLPRGSVELLDLYREAPWLRAVTHKIAFATSSVAWRLYVRKGGPQDAGRKYIRDKHLQRCDFGARTRGIEDGIAAGELVEWKSHPFIDLFDKPNERMTGRAARQVAQTHLDLVGETYLVLDTNELGMPVRMWPIPPTWVTDLPTTTRPTYRISFLGGMFEVPITHVVPIRDPNPADPWRRGAGIGEALRDEIDSDEYAAKHVASWFHNKAMPDMIIGFEGANPGALERAKRTWEQKLRGFARSYQTHWTNAKISAQRLDTSFKDMALIDIRKFERDTFIQTYGVPPELLGILTNSNRATITSADYLFAKHCLMPRLELWRSELQMRLIPLFDERLILAYDSPIPADVEAERAVMLALPQFAMIDEVRARQGLPPLPDKKGQGFLVPPGFTYVAALDEVTPAIQQFHVVAGIPTVNEVRDQLSLPPRPDGDVPTSGLVVHETLTAPASGTPPPAAPPPAETPAQGDNAEPVPAPAKSLGVRRCDLTDGNLEQILNAVDTESMRRSMEPVIASLVESWGNQTIKALDDSLSFDVSDPAVDAHVREFANDRIGRLINGTTRDELQATLTEAIAQGETRTEIVARVREVFRRADVERSDIIAQTESLRSSQFATTKAFEQSEIDMKREWISTHDGRAREEHLAMDGQTRGLTEPFEVPIGPYKGAKTQQPGGFGIGALDIRCRCVISALLPDDAGSASLHAGGGVVRRIEGAKATEAARREVWKAADEKLQPWDARIARAAVSGFNAQERRVLDVVDSLLS